MENQNTYQGISKRSNVLLMHQEGTDVEFKREINALELTDLVAFANSPSGGTIFIGIDEIDGPDGIQKARIIGCAVGDRERLIINNKAADCIPPIDLEIYFENLKRTPFIRIEISSGKYKPYCTKKGIYTIRVNNRVNALLPEKLLSIFIEAEGEAFLHRFREATHEIVTNLNLINKGTSDLHNTVQEMQFGVEGNLEGILESTSNAESLSDVAESISEDILYSIQELKEKSEDFDYKIGRIENNIDILLKHFNLEDPQIVNARNRTIRKVEKLLCENEKLDPMEATNLLFWEVGISGIDFTDVLGWCTKAIKDYQNKTNNVEGDAF